VQRAIARVECYDLAAAILELDPGNLNALEALGRFRRRFEELCSSMTFDSCETSKACEWKI